MKDKLLVILGPTATGKTDLALSLAKKFNGELVSCDSRQVYTGLDIGTGKLPSGKWKIDGGRWKKGRGWWVMDGVRVWMYDVINPDKQYTVADYIKGAGKVIREIRWRGKLPIVVGGTGLYLRVLLYGLSSLSAPVNSALRKKLERLSLNKLQEKLQALSIKRWENMNYSDRQNPRRLIRAIELKIGKGSKGGKGNRGLIREFNILKIGLTAQREILYKRVDGNVVNRIDQGIIKEAEKLHKNGLSLKRMRELGLEYGVLADYLDGKIKSHDELIKTMQGKIHGFVRRQLTWFKKEKDIIWFSISENFFYDEVENTMAKWYYAS